MFVAALPLVAIAATLLGLAFQAAQHPAPWARDLTYPLRIGAVAAVVLGLVIGLVEALGLSGPA